jgi:membrane associated rhomboid family serine protease
MNNSIFEDIKRVFKSGNYLYQIIIINVVIFILLNVLLAIIPKESEELTLRFFGLSADLNQYFWRIWTYFSYMFTHVAFDHIFFNMLILYMIGRIFADLYGNQKFLETYLYGGLLGGVLFIVTAYVIPSLSVDHYLMGASAAVMSVVIAIGFLQPEYMLQIFTFRVPLKYVVLFAFITSSILNLNINTGGKIAHFGGAVYGFIFAYYLQRGTNINEPITKFFKSLTSFLGPKKIKVVHKNSNYKKQQEDQISQEEVDKILDKISKSGYDSLTKVEKDFLFKFGKK